MPVTARLSKAFYDRFGEEATNELVNWFNQVDATYRADLRELNELNYARFEARIDKAIAGLEVRLERRLGEQARWLFAAWASLLIPIIGLWMRR